MLISFSIQNFGSIKDKQTLSFEADNSDHLEDYYVIKAGGLRLLKLGLIYGANASGKTTVLKALDFLRKLALEPKSQKNETLDFQPFLFDAETPHQPSILSVEFLQDDVRYFYEVEFTQEAIVREELYVFNPKKANVFKRTTDVEKQFASITFGSKIKISKTSKEVLEANTLWNNTVLGGFLKTNLRVFELFHAKLWFSKKLVLTISTNLAVQKSLGFLGPLPIIKKNIVSMLQKADFNIEDVQLDKSMEIAQDLLNDIQNDSSSRKFELASDEILEKIRFEHTVNGTRYSLPVKLESQGTQRYYGFSVLMAMLVFGSLILPIDELESSLHPDLYTHFLLTFLVNAKSSQLIATTHNREILNNKDLFRNDAIWFTQKNESSATELYSLADFDSSVVRDTTNVYNAYKVGKLGAVPNLGDYYIDFKSEDEQ